MICETKAMPDGEQMTVASRFFFAGVPMLPMLIVFVTLNSQERSFVSSKTSVVNREPQVKGLGQGQAKMEPSWETAESRRPSGTHEFIGHIWGIQPLRSWLMSGVAARRVANGECPVKSGKRESGNGEGEARMTGHLKMRT